MITSVIVLLEKYNTNGTELKNNKKWCQLSALSEIVGNVEAGFWRVRGMCWTKRIVLFFSPAFNQWSLPVCSVHMKYIADSLDQYSFGRVNMQALRGQILSYADRCFAI